MRLWHIDLIAYLPKGQLLSQWRELNSIFAKEDQHILINYIYEYPKEDLYLYTEKVMDEMKKRGYQIRTYEKRITTLRVWAQ
ncbi:pyrimidine dimer DNA glycosylase/endonuclease V [Lysinibacillus sp. YS11]|uniref:pyrimidine dimer DNA glycosylase/endonuclease V n=1 Tax=Lysinibacillus sp. YS11 TaxID=2072025 RepID=UPI001F30EFCE|nr:pyrimidine dimer DNA glycosylase/endonuclease V [Lysinibacillus sp. YS11]